MPLFLEAIWVMIPTFLSWLWRFWRQAHLSVFELNQEALSGFTLPPLPPKAQVFKNHSSLYFDTSAVFGIPFDTVWFQLLRIDEAFDLLDTANKATCLYTGRHHPLCYRYAQVFATSGQKRIPRRWQRFTIVFSAQIWTLPDSSLWVYGLEHNGQAWEIKKVCLFGADSAKQTLGNRLRVIALA